MFDLHVEAKKKHIVLLVFIHGFKGDDSSFKEFPYILRSRLAQRLPKVRVVTAVFPKYATKGNLAQSAANVLSWLQTIVEELEGDKTNRHNCPAVDVILLGHSMGGIVAAETLILLAENVKFEESKTRGSPSWINKLIGEPKSTLSLVPRIRGLLGFDSPFLGISPGVLIFTAELQYKKAAAAMKSASNLLLLSPLLHVHSKSNPKKNEDGTDAGSENNNQENQGHPSPTPSGMTWGSIASMANAAGAIERAGAYYKKRDRLLQKSEYITSHLDFFGAIMTHEDRQDLLSRLSRVQSECRIHATNFYTSLGQAVDPSGIRLQRTFCAVPEDALQNDGINNIKWTSAVNSQVSSEIDAHVSMFSSQTNSDFENLENETVAQIIAFEDRGFWGGHWW